MKKEHFEAAVNRDTRDTMRESEEQTLELSGGEREAANCNRGGDNYVCIR